MVHSFARVGLGSGALLCLMAAFATIAALTVVAHRDGFFMSHARIVVLVNGYSVPIDTCTYLGLSGIYGRLPVQDQKTGTLTCDGE